MTAVLAPTPGGQHAKEPWPSGRSPPARRFQGLLHRVARGMAVSVTTTVLSLAILMALTLNVPVGAGWANAVAWGVGTVASYRLNRRWVWAERTGDDALRQVVPFWLLPLGGLLVSTVAVRPSVGPLQSSSPFNRRIPRVAVNLTFLPSFSLAPGHGTGERAGLAGR